MWLRQGWNSVSSSDQRRAPWLQDVLRSSSDSTSTSLSLSPDHLETKDGGDADGEGEDSCSKGLLLGSSCGACLGEVPGLVGGGSPKSVSSTVTVSAPLLNISPTAFTRPPTEAISILVCGVCNSLGVRGDNSGRIENAQLPGPRFVQVD